MAGVYETLSFEQKLRLSLQADVQDIYREAAEILGLEVHEQAVDLITELAWKKLHLYALDLESFCKHAKRTTINAEDVKLLVRRNASLKTHVITMAENFTSAGGSRDKKKKNNMSAASTSTAMTAFKTRLSDEAKNPN